MTPQRLSDEEWLHGASVSIRPLTLQDCTPVYLAWLQDPDVNRYLETRWSPQSPETIRAFVAAMRASPQNHLFAIVERVGGAHVGNLKVGPVHPVHSHADVSYFIGERRYWNKGYASEAIQLATRFGFERLGLHRLDAGVYASNVASARALEKCGFRREGCFAQKLRTRPDGPWEDHLWYGLVRRDWEAEK